MSEKLFVGPDVRMTEDDVTVCVIRRGTVRAKYSCWCSVETVNSRSTLIGDFLRIVGGMMEVPHGANNVRMGMLIFGFQCC